MENNKDMKIANFMVPTASRPYVSIENIPGVEYKPMNILDKPNVWSSTILIKKGCLFPKRKNSSLCEFMVISGEAKYLSGETFKEGDYFRESEGEYNGIKAITDTVLFLTNHGVTSFIGANNKVLWESTPITIKEL